jgi:hypothetical protein
LTASAINAALAQGRDLILTTPARSTRRCCPVGTGGPVTPTNPGTVAPVDLTSYP